MRSAALFIILCALSGCATRRVPPVSEFPAVPGQSFFLVSAIGYDDRGRPLFGDRLRRRPGAPGDRFTVVHAIGGRAARSYNIVIREREADLARPFLVVYEWTGRGYEGGVAIAEGMFPQGVTIRSGEEAAAFLAIKAAPVAVATVTGFVVGVLASIPETVKLLGQVLVNADETITGRAEYSYDDRGRIRFLKLYPPEEQAEALVRTEYIYDGESDLPSRTEVHSTAEGKVRTVP